MNPLALSSSTSMLLRRGALAVAAALAVASTGCGGGGGGGSQPAPAGTTLGTMASSVTSSDGKVTVGVGDNALQAPVEISIAPATPDAAIAADPSYVPGTTYAYSAPAIQVPDQVLITIESPLAVGAAAAAAPSGRKFAQAFPPGYQPPPTCLVNSPLVLNGTLTAQNILIQTPGTGTDAQCPQSPAPGCILVFNPNPANAVCAPSQDVIIAPSVADSCPPGYREVTERGRVRRARRGPRLRPRLPAQRQHHAAGAHRPGPHADRELHADGRQVHLRRAGAAERHLLGAVGHGAATRADVRRQVDQRRHVRLQGRARNRRGVPRPRLRQRSARLRRRRDPRGARPAARKRGARQPERAPGLGGAGQRRSPARR